LYTSETPSKHAASYYRFLIGAERLPRVRFDTSLTNAIRQVGLHGEIVEHEPTISPASSVTPRPIGLVARCLRPLFRKPARFFRSFLVGEIGDKLDQAQRTLNAVEASFARMSDVNQQTLRAVEVSIARMSDVNQQTLKAVEVSIASIGDANQQISTLFARVDALETRLAELAIKVRTPIAVDDSTVASRTADGFVFVPRADTALLLMLCDAGPEGLEPGTRRLLTRLLAPGMMFVDVGAHIGLLTLCGARVVGPQGRVVAFEPTPPTFDLLTRALAINGVSHRVEAHCLACGARRERRAFYVGTVLGHSSLLGPAPLSSARAAQEIEAEVVRLDDVVPTGERVDLVKIDVEGTELEVLVGMTRIIRENPDLMIIAEFGPAHLARAGTTPDAWFEAFLSHGFQAYAINELSGECHPVDQCDLTAVESVNILFCRPNSPVAKNVGS
jgi:FkbM family methyltransferase